MLQGEELLSFTGKKKGQRTLCGMCSMQLSSCIRLFMFEHTATQF